MNFKALPLALMLVLSVAVLAACGGSDDTSTGVSVTDGTVAEIPDVSVNTDDIGPYPEDVKSEFVKSCTASSDGQKPFCECLIQAYEDTLPYDMFKDVNDSQAQGTIPRLPTATQDAADACATKVQ